MYCTATRDKSSSFGVLTVIEGDVKVGKRDEGECLPLGSTERRVCIRLWCGGFIFECEEALVLFLSYFHNEGSIRDFSTFHRSYSYYVSFFTKSTYIVGT